MVCPCRGGGVLAPVIGPRREVLDRSWTEVRVEPPAILDCATGRGAVWERAAFGSPRSPVRIRPPRSSGVLRLLARPAAAEHAAQRRELRGPLPLALGHAAGADGAQLG